MGPDNSHSRNSAAKLMHMIPSHERPFLATMAGMPSTSISSSLRRMPSRDRKPTMILGTPRRKDWIQNLHNLLSKLL